MTEKPPGGPSQTEPAQSRRVGRYQLVERLAIGGMAEVFLAAERGNTHSLQRLLVIKRILPHLAQDAAFVEMFLHEARVAARIQHPNVVQIFELGESGGYPYIAMEYVEGSTLKELLNAANKNGVPLPVSAAVWIAMESCDGIHAAHELTDDKGKNQGLVHRDLSPHNLMITADAHVKLLDFGIAKATSSMPDNTRTGMLKGKVSYMAPEQCQQDDIDRRADIFALGTVFWELFAGRKLFEGKTDLATLQMVVQGQIQPLREVRPDVPEAIAAVIHKALSMKIEDRWTTAQEMRRAFAAAAQSAGITLDRDRTALFIKTMLGEVQETRRRHITQAMERTLVTLSNVPFDPVVRENRTNATRSKSLRGTATAGVLGAFGLMLAGATALTVIAVGIAVMMAVRPSTPVDTGPPVFVGTPMIISVVVPNDGDVARTELEPFRTWLQTELQRPITFDLRNSYTEVADHLVKGQTEFARLPPNTYLEVKEEIPELQVLAMQQWDGSQGTDGYILAPETHPGKVLADFKGSTFCYVNDMSATGYILPRYYMKKNGMNPDKDFKGHFSTQHDLVMRDLIAGLCEVGGVYSGAYRTADEFGIQASKLKVLAVTGRTPHDAWVASPQADPETAQALQKALLAFDPQKAFKRVSLGESERITGFVPGSDADYGELRDARKALGIGLKKKP